MNQEYNKCKCPSKVNEYKSMTGNVSQAFLYS